MPAGQTCSAKSMICLVSEGKGSVSIRMPPSEDTTSPAFTSAYRALVNTQVSSATLVRVIATLYIPFRNFQARAGVEKRIISQSEQSGQWGNQFYAGQSRTFRIGEKGA